MSQISNLGTLIFLCCTLTISSQGSLMQTSITKGKIYALIIGISGYRDKEIPQLKYAHRDAQIFADYLSSKAGGSVSSAQIKLLTNEQATVSNIYVAKQWLETTAKENDLVFFYFSGHGDVESGLYKLGFLLAYDTPFKNYLNNAVRIEDINNMANTLSIEKNVNVILITDACHSGKLAGSDNRGNALVGEQLAKVEKKEIRIASCESDQLSQEDEAWGGGRGVFSYYLINGMKGLADAGDEDGIITLQEIRTYIESRITTDVANIKQEEQTPIVQGKNMSKIAIVDDEALKELKAESTTLTIAAQSDSGAKSVDFKPGPMDKYFDELAYHSLKMNIDSTGWRIGSADEFVDLALKTFPADQGDSVAQLMFNKSIHSNKNIRYEYKQRFASAIHNEVQSAINAYLSGSREELAKREYYNVYDQAYGVYVDMLTTAMNLIDTTNHLYHIMQVKKHYFQGVSHRLKMVISDNLDSLVNLALAEQKKALSLEGKAAYVLNEIGILYFYLKNYREAEKFYNKAIELVPTWAIPRSNLSGLYYQTGRYEEGLATSRKAIALQNDHSLAYMNAGLNAEKLGNFLVAEESYLNASTLNEKHFLPSGELAKIYLRTTEYHLADSFFLQAEIKKKGFENPTNLAFSWPPINPTFNTMTQANIALELPCNIDTSMFGQADVMANVAYAILNINNEDLAEKYLKKAIGISPNDPVAYRYLFNLMHNQSRWIEAEVFYKIAQNNYLQPDSFSNYVMKLKKSQTYLACNISEIYYNQKYNSPLNDYELADVYSKWGYLGEAETIFRAKIKKDSSDHAGYKLLWTILESQDQYQSAENVLLSIPNDQPFRKEIELQAFYDRMIAINIDINKYKLKAGLLMYGIAMDNYEFSTIHNENSANKGIKYFESIDTDIDSSTRADICNKLGDLYSQVKKEEESKKYYRLATAIVPHNASIKNKLIQKQIRDYEFSDALNELDYLYKHDQINADRLLDYIKFTIHSGNVKYSEIVLQKSEKAFPVYNKTYKEYTARHFLFADMYKEAIEEFTKLLSHNPDQKASIFYTLSRIYAITEENERAIDYLNKAMAAGFRYTWVIDKDAALDKLRDSEVYKALRARLPESRLD